jgi:PAS domain-containing protein
MNAPIGREPTWRDLLLALPAAVVVVNTEYRVVALNPAAEEAFGVGQADVLGRGPGHTFQCLNAEKDLQGCGHSPECSRCEVRKSAGEVLAGTSFSQKEIRISVPDGRRNDSRVFLFSASPLEVGPTRLAVLMLQEVTVYHRLRGLIPICAACKKIRRDDRAWEELEKFIEAHSHAEFTHGMCPQCLERYYPDFKR